MVHAAKDQRNDRPNRNLARPGARQALISHQEFYEATCVLPDEALIRDDIVESVSCRMDTNQEIDRYFRFNP